MYRSLVCWVLLLWSGLAGASVPSELQPWVPWVMEKHPELACPNIAGVRACVWPGVLALDVDETGGRFSLDVHLDREARLDLPGGDGAWPLALVANGKPVAVLPDANGVPGLTLAAGTWRLSGVYRWPSLPGSLKVPAGVGQVALVVDGAPVPSPRLDSDGTLRLGAGDQRAPEENRLDLDVSRKIIDGVPLGITTRLALRASGSGREVSLGRVLLAGSAAVSLEADLPARLTADGELIVQVRPGSFTITLHALQSGATTDLSAPTLGAPWPEAEVWVVQQDDRVRAVNLSGVPAVDPARTSLAEDWRGMPTFLVGGGQTLHLEELRRGEPQPPPNQLSLTRELWLDMDGGGLTARDTWMGLLNQGWRLEMPAPAALGHVADHGTDQVITTSELGSGVELRRTDVALVAESRLEPRPSSLRAVGWSADVTSLSATLRLPPGWTLLGATGVDTVRGALLDAWTLLDLFFVLVVSVALGRMHGPRWGLVALVGLTLSRQEPGSPAVSWVVLLVVSALERVLSSTRLALASRLARLAVVIGLLLVLLPFSLDRVRASFFPALENAWQSATSLDQDARYEPQPKDGWAEGGDVFPASESSAEVIGGLVGRGGGYQAEARAQKKDAAPEGKGSLSLQQDPSSVVQTGPGVPAWGWDQVELGWTGPVSADQELRLWLIGPVGNAILGLGQVLLLVALALRLSGLDRLRLPKSAASALLLLLVVPDATAAPSTELLTELEARLTAAPACDPACASVSTAKLTVAGDRLIIEAQVSAGAPASWPVPGPTATWVPAYVTLDGRPSSAMARLSDGFLHVRLDPGVHVVRAEGPLPAALSLTLQFGLVPKRLDWQGEGWTLDGVRANGAVESAVQLTRAMDAEATRENTSAENLAPWLELHRTLDLGIPWRVRTELVRVGPADRPLSLRVPLLPGEAVTEAGFEVRDGAVLATLAADQERTSWLSTLAESPSFTLTAPSGVPWTERWTLWCSPIYSCRADGPPPIHHTGDSDEGTRWAPEWRPWPGEAITITASRPDAVAGQTITVDRADLATTPGRRISQSSLTLSIRTSQGGQQSLRLPEGAQLQQVKIDGLARPIQLRDGALPIPLRPGAQTVEIGWQQDSDRWMGLYDRAPAVDLGGPAVNTTVTIHSAEERWTLWLSGPRWGPKPLIWSFVVVVLAAAGLLARVPLAPLTATSWALLGLGLTQVSPVETLFIVGWFMAMGWRARHPAKSWASFDLGQLALLALTLIAAGCLFDAVRRGLLLAPDMDIQGNGSSDSALVWYQDRVDGALPRPAVLSLPLMAWRVAMLAWALWLALQVVRWAPWAWRCFTAEGLWRWPERPAKTSPAPPAEDAG